ncbi:hypothetical protein [Catalinimonas niigatensis]|uniref:hypothetical protein n=1 Tax=Catalinimonas niigatensis TaxID=1397264 RepID=UPI00266521B6|nr:hypothetical protein [Catalinimonas niigatensis]WPP49475.1 hypothetical protein PZB72_22655 [Catalinimonas niigatensis]
MQPLKRDINLPAPALLLLCGLFWITACESDLITDDPQPNMPNTPTVIDPDKASEYLILSDASKINGTLPDAPDGPLQISVEDTMYLVSGMPFGARLVVKHDGQQDISGFYIGVLNSSFYYDVPVVAAESGDSTEVLYINIGDAGGIDWGEFPIEILPHGPGNLPFKKFIRQVKVESPKDEDTCSPLTPAPTCYYDEDSVYYCHYLGGIQSWIWEFTVVEDATGDIHTAYAPFMFLNTPVFKHGGCCWNGNSIPAKEDPYCVPGNPEFREITVEDAYYVRYWEYLDLFDNNTYRRRLRHETNNYSTDSSNYCSGEAGYITNRSHIRENGTHDFSLGDDDIHFKRDYLYDFNDPENQYNFWTASNGSIFYTCRSLIISYIINGEKWSVVYKRNLRRDGIVEDFFEPEFYE